VEIQKGPHNISVNIMMDLGEEDRPAAYGILVVIYGDKDYPFNEIDKEAMKVTIGEAVEKIMLPGQEGEIFTLSITDQERRKR